jgi:uracil-DNA glycosylase family protein
MAKSAPATVESFDGRKCEVTWTASPFVPKTRSLAKLGTACNACHGCPIYCNATQAVFGEGSKGSAVMFVGEQPGDQEDLAGKPFVGPSGRLLDEMMDEAGIDRKVAYVTNAVKHFKWEPRGKRRLHAKPSAREVDACRPWLEAEITLIDPAIIVCLGATAARSLMGSKFRLTQHRGEVIKTDRGPLLLATTHPSAVLRAPNPELRRESRAAMVADLKVVAKKLKRL